MKKFVVMSTMRSGTTWLISLLDSHEQITCAGEMLHSDLRQCEHITYHKEFSLGYFFKDRPEKREIAKYNQRQVLFEYLDWFYASIGDSSALGFKLMLNHIYRFPEIMEYIQERNVKVILLLRTNLVDRLISHALKSTSKSQQEMTAIEKIRSFLRGYKFARKNSSGQLILNLRDSMRKLSTYENENAALMNYAAKCETEVIYYQDLVDNKDDCLRIVFPFLDVNPLELTSPRKKIRTKKINEIVKNYSELSKRLEGTRFQKFLR